jgi:hypothetical protein
MDTTGQHHHTDGGPASDSGSANYGPVRHHRARRAQRMEGALTDENSNTKNKFKNPPIICRQRQNGCIDVSRTPWQPLALDRYRADPARSADTLEEQLRCRGLRKFYLPEDVGPKNDKVVRVRNGDDQEWLQITVRWLAAETKKSGQDSTGHRLLPSDNRCGHRTVGGLTIFSELCAGSPQGYRLYVYSTELERKVDGNWHPSSPPASSTSSVGDVHFSPAPPPLAVRFDEAPQPELQELFPYSSLLPDEEEDSAQPALNISEHTSTAWPQQNDD